MNFLNADKVSGSSHHISNISTGGRNCIAANLGLRLTGYQSKENKSCRAQPVCMQFLFQTPKAVYKQVHTANQPLHSLHVD